MTAPIALFVYNRPAHTKRTVDALASNALASESDLFVFADAPRDDAAIPAVAAVRAHVRGLQGFRSVTLVEREHNLGVDASIIDGVSTMCDRHGEVVVLEDDLVTSPWFLTYMNEGLRRYRDEERVMQVSGFMFPIDGVDESSASLLPYSTCWGWGTWQRAWARYDAKATIADTLRRDTTARRAFNLDDGYDYFALLEAYVAGRSTAWDICWYASVVANDGLSLFPNRTFVENIGFDGSGVHCIATDHIDDRVAQAPITGFPAIQKNELVWAAVQRYVASRKPTSSLPKHIRRIVRRAREWSLSA